MKQIIGIIFLLCSINLFSQIDALHYNIHIDSIDFANQQIYGKTNVQLYVGANQINEIQLDLLDLVVDSIKNYDTICTFTYDNSIITIYGEFIDTADITVYYHGHPTLDVSGWGGFYFVGEYAFNMGIGLENIPHNLARAWFASIDNFTDKATYDYYINTNINKKAVCGGILVDSTFINSYTIQWHWHNPHPIPAYLASVAVGPYVAWKDTVQGMNGILPIEIYLPSSSLDKVPGSFQNLKKIFHIFEEYYGLYQWSKIGFVGVPFNSGAMEHAMNIAYPISCINGNLTYESLYAHELSHQWFGNLVTCKTSEEMWINEGWARFSEILFTEKLYGNNAANTMVKNLMADVLSKAHKEDGGFYSLCDMPQTVTYGTTVYDKGALIAHTLRNYLNDSAFFGATKSFINQFVWSNASCNDMQNSFEQYTGNFLTDFFQNYLYNTGSPHYRIDTFTVYHNCGVNFIQLYTSQHRFGGDFLTESDSIEIWLWGSNRELDSLKINLGFINGITSFNHIIAPVDIWIDPNQKTADAIINGYAVMKNTNNYSILHTNVTITPTILADSLEVFVEHHLIGPDQLFKENPIYRVSPNHYWTIHIPYLYNNSSVKARFIYNRSQYNTSDPSDLPLLSTSSSVDSLVLVYRKNSHEPWQIVNFTKTGSQISGYLVTDNAKAGDYAFAISDPITNIEQTINDDNDFYIFPNPANDLVNIKSSSPGTIQIFSTLGELIYEQNIDNELIIHLNLKGIFIVRYTDVNKLSYQKILIVN
jgi:aminopeptidase N